MIIIEIDIELYKIFYTVAKFGNITKAANALYISQPAVTMSIKKLEEQLETTLFTRTKRGVVLTNEGSVLYEHVEKAMENIKIGENRLSSLKKLENGTIKIGIGTTLAKFFLVEHLAKYHEKYPNISINIDTSKTSDILKKLDDGSIDIAIITNDTCEFKNFNVEYSEDITYTFICNKNYLELTNKEIPLEELAQYPLLLQHSHSNSRRILNDFVIKNKVEIEADMELSSYSLVIEFAKIGLGIGFVGKNFVKQELENKELYEIKVNPKLPNQKILVLSKKDYMPSFSAKKLIEIICTN